jgi:hypothetical protein
MLAAEALRVAGVLRARVAVAAILVGRATTWYLVEDALAIAAAHRLAQALRAITDILAGDGGGRAGVETGRQTPRGESHQSFHRPAAAEGTGQGIEAIGVHG